MTKISNRILIVRLGAIGDVIRTLPALRALRLNLPETYIAWAVEDRAASILKSHPDLNDVLVVPRKKWQHNPCSLETLKEVRLFIKNLRGEKFDTVLDFHGLFKSGLITFFSKAKNRVGFSRKFCKELNFLFTNNHVSLPSRKINRVEKNLLLIKSLGFEVTNHDPIIPISDEDRKFADAFIPPHKQPSRHCIILMHPGSSLSTPYKRWNFQRFARLADTLIQKHQAKILFTAGKDEWPLIKSITDQMEKSDYILCPTKTLTQLAEIIRRCDLYIGNDTAPMHLAAFLKTPVIALFGPTDPIENSPYGKGKVIMIRKDVSCNPCRKRNCQKGFCMDAIEVKEVVASAERILL